MRGNIILCTPFSIWQVEESFYHPPIPSNSFRLSPYSLQSLMKPPLASAHGVHWIGEECLHFVRLSSFTKPPARKTNKCAPNDVSFPKL